MYKYAITKYNPHFRDEEGRYLKEDWIAISDIGKLFDGEMLTADHYMKIEDSYIQAIQMVMEYMKIPFLMVNQVARSFSYDTFMEMNEQYRELYSKELLETYTHIKDLDELDKEQVGSFCRLVLREDMWAKVYYPRRMKVFIAYDYLMGIHTSKSIETIIPLIEQLGLFVEEH
ncbi:hypothetical protein QPK24_03750 [Paenibacillus polygoni]|uniref:Uncharacterized protein n=1 Tax=Paenibacillus polygoni TaxID=3050112 RepID=A0ABY8X3X3_9BACL|nr:hypothetical protein [Paenibacillus polygoni]WIV19864.1 hypothetical protein QPK24_03750 [Paenibacillus polygoni]